MSERNLPNLDKIFRDEDEPDFLPSAGSNLAAIFGMTHKVQENQPPLKQVAQKKRSIVNNVSHANPQVKTEVIIATAVNAFKLINGQYVSIGKLGMALTGNISTKVYQIILYKSKQEHLSVVTITHDFTYNVQENNYASYYDANNENWSILFENNESFIEFAREIGLAKYFSKQGKLDNNIIYQNLTPVAKDAVAKEWDNLDIQYSIRTEITQSFKSNKTSLQTATVQISTDDNWERSLLGISKGAKRLLFVCPSKQISLGPGFPKETDIMLEIQVMDIQTPDENTIPKPTISSKASILSRMAKMGQSILPKLQTSTTTDSEDTEEDVPHKSPRHKRTDHSDTHTRRKNSVEETGPIRKAHGIVNTLNDESSDPGKFKPAFPATNFSPAWTPTRVQPHYVTLDGQMYPLATQNAVPSVPAVMDPTLNIVLSESRMANAEIRMGMSKIADNVQKLLDKFHALELHNATTPSSEKSMEATLKMILAMNTPHNRINDNQFNDKTLVSDEKKDNSDKRELKLSAEKAESLQEEISKLKNKVVELEELLKDSNDSLQKTLEDLKDSRNIAAQYKDENNVLQNKTLKLVAQCNALQSTTRKENEMKTKEIKQIMTETYHILLEKFTEESYPTTYIKTNIANTIRDVTLQVLKEGKSNESELVQSIEIDESQDISNQFQNVVANTTEKTKSFVEPPPIPPMDDAIDDFE